MVDWIARFSLLGAPAQALIILSGGVVAATLSRVVFRTWIAWLTARTRTDLDDRAAAVLEAPVAWTLLAGAAWVAAHRFALPAPLPYLRDGLLQSALVVVWVGALAQIVTFGLAHLMEHHERYAAVTPRTLPLFDLAGRILVYGGGVYFFFLAWDIDVAGWLAGAGIVGVAVGFAAQDTLGNLIAGMFILADAPYKLGDFLQIEGGVRGRVTEIGIRTTRLITQDDIEIIVPNSKMANSTIVNESGGPSQLHRVRVDISVAYGSDVDRVRAELLGAPEGVVGIAPQPAPRVRFRRFGASGLEFQLLVWVDHPQLRGRVIDALNTAIAHRFGAAGIEIPYDKLDVYVKEAPGAPQGPA